MKFPRWIVRIANRIADPPEIQVRASEFGVSEHAEDNAPMLQEAIDFAARVGAVTNVRRVAVTLPDGAFRVASTINLEDDGAR